MKDVLNERAAQLTRLAMMIRIGLDSAESAIPGINDQLAELATLGITDFQIEGPAVYCRPAGPSSAFDDSHVVFQAVILMPGGIGPASPRRRSRRGAGSNVIVTIAAARCSVLCTRPYHLSKIALILGPYVYFTAAELGRFAIKRRPSGWRSGPSGSDRQADDGGTPR